MEFCQILHILQWGNPQKVLPIMKMELEQFSIKAAQILESDFQMLECTQQNQLALQKSETF